MEKKEKNLTDIVVAFLNRLDFEEYSVDQGWFGNATEARQWVLDHQELIEKMRKDNPLLERADTLYSRLRYKTEDDDFVLDIVKDGWAPDRESAKKWLSEIGIEPNED